MYKTFKSHFTWPKFICHPTRLIRFTKIPSQTSFRFVQSGSLPTQYKIFKTVLAFVYYLVLQPRPFPLLAINYFIESEKWLDDDLEKNWSLDTVVRSGVVLLWIIGIGRTSEVWNPHFSRVNFFNGVLASLCIWVDLNKSFSLFFTTTAAAQQGGFSESLFELKAFLVCPAFILELRILIYGNSWVQLSPFLD